MSEIRCIDTNDSVVSTTFHIDYECFLEFYCQNGVVFCSELRQRLVSPRPAGRPPPGPGSATSAPPTPLSAPGGPPEKGLATSTPHGLIRRPGTLAGTPAPGMGESHVLSRCLIGFGWHRWAGNVASTKTGRA